MVKVVALTHTVKVQAFLRCWCRVLCRRLTAHGKLYFVKPTDLRACALLGKEKSFIRSINCGLRAAFEPQLARQFYPTAYS